MIEFNVASPKFKKQRHSAMQRRGLAYEKKVLKWLKANHDDWDYFPKPWLKVDGKYIQPDAVLVHDHVVIVEIKLTYREDALEKSWLVYGPPLMAHFEKPIRCVQIFHNHRDGEPSDSRPLEELFLHTSDLLHF